MRRLAAKYEGGQFVTLRITPTMYHRFHAPHDLDVEHVTYISGDTWNVYPIALKNVERLFCRNERAILRCRLTAFRHVPFLLVPVAAILVASIRLHCADVLLHLKYAGPNQIPCDARYAKGQEMGWFQHGSTIIALVPKGMSLCEDVREGQRDPHGRAVDPRVSNCARRRRQSTHPWPARRVGVIRHVFRIRVAKSARASL